MFFLVIFLENHNQPRLFRYDDVDINKPNETHSNASPLEVPTNPHKLKIIGNERLSDPHKGRYKSTRY